MFGTAKLEELQQKLAFAQSELDKAKEEREAARALAYEQGKRAVAVEQFAAEQAGMISVLIDQIAAMTAEVRREAGQLRQQADNDRMRADALAAASERDAETIQAIRAILEPELPLAEVSAVDEGGQPLVYIPLVNGHADSAARAHDAEAAQ